MAHRGDNLGPDAFQAAGVSRHWPQVSPQSYIQSVCFRFYCPMLLRSHSGRAAIRDPDSWS